MSETAVAVRTVTADELELVKRTVANGATDAELKLFLFDCARQGVHPLDRLIHFTKRSGKYTPITSIDFMRIRAADSGEMAGSDDPVYRVRPNPAGDDFMLDAATVTVYRITQGQRFAYTATARWSEYKPEQNDFMWRKMPHTMLGKCAEALALRKGFPRQLAGLYAKEELDQADATPVSRSSVEGMVHPHVDSSASPDRVAPSDSGDSGQLSTDEGPDLEVDLPDGARLIRRVGDGAHGAACEIEFTNGETYLTWNRKLREQAEEWQRERVPVMPDFKVSVSGNTRIEHLVPVALPGQAF